MNTLYDVEGAANPDGLIQANFEILDAKLGFPVIVDSTTERTLGVGDASAWIRCTNAGAINVIVPPQADEAWLAGTEVVIEQAGEGQVTVVAASGVTINSSETLLTRAQFAVVALKRVGADEWTLTGEREAAGS